MSDPLAKYYKQTQDPLAKYYTQPEPEQDSGIIPSISKYYKTKEEKANKFETDAKAIVQGWVDSAFRPGSFGKAAAELVGSNAVTVTKFLGDPIIGAKQAFEGIGQGVHDVIGLFGALKEEPLKTVGAVGKGFVQPVGDLLQALDYDFKKKIGQEPNITPEQAEEKYKSFITAAVGFYAGAKAYQALRGTGKITSVAKTLSKAADKAVVAGGLSDDVLQAASIVKRTTGFAASALKGGATIATANAVPGLVYGETIQDKFANAFNQGIVGTATGMMLGLAGKSIGLLRKAKPEGFDDVRAAIHEVITKRNIEAADAVLPTSEFADDLVSAAKAAFSPDEIADQISRHAADGDFTVISGAPSTVAARPNISVHKQVDGTLRTLVGNVDDVIRGQFETHGFFEGMEVEYAGKRYFIANSADQKTIFYKGKAKLFDPATGTLVKALVDVDKLSYVPDKFQIRSSTGAVKGSLKGYLDIFDPDEAVKLDKLIAEAQGHRDNQIIDATSRLASNGIRVKSVNGELRLHDIAKDMDIGPVKNLAELDKASRQFFSTPSGELIRASGESPIDPANMPPKIPERKVGKLEKIVQWSRTTPFFGFFTDAEKMSLAFDNTYGTDFYNSFFLPWQKKLRVAKFAQNEFVKAAEGLHARAIKLFPDVPDNLLFDLLEATSADEILSADPTKRLFRARNFSDLEKLELEFFKQTEGGGEGLRKAARAVYHVIKQNEDVDPIAAVIEHGRSIGLTENQIERSVRIIKGAGADIAEFSVRGPLEAAIASLEGHRTFDDLVKAYKFSSEQIEWFKDMRAVYDKLAPKLGVRPEQMTNHYQPHIFAKDTPSDIPARLRPLVENPDFMQALHRLGVRDDYIKSPTYVLLSYINSGFRKKFEIPDAVKDFTSIITEEAKKVKVKSGYNLMDAGEYVRNKMLTHMQESQSFLGPDDLAAIAANEKLGEIIGVPATKWNNLSRRFLGVSSFATMGYNPYQGIRDMASVGMLYSTTLGFKAARRFFELMDDSDSGFETFLREKGFNPAELHRFMFEEEARFDTPGWIHGARELKNKIADQAFEFSLQRQVYERVHRGAFLERYTTVLDEYSKFVKHKDIGKFRRALELDSYDAPIADKFVDMINNGKVNEAAKYLGVTTGWQMVGVYGLANHPIGWGGQVGRLFGQFGKWPIWMSQTINNQVSKGNPRTALRWVAITGALMTAGYATGINFGDWVMFPGNNMFTGSPALDLMKDAVSAATASTEYERDLARRELARRNPFVNPKQVFVPVPFSVWNALEALGLFSTSDETAYYLENNPMLVGARLASMSISPWTQFGIPINEQARNK